MQHRTFSKRKPVLCSFERLEGRTLMSAGEVAGVILINGTEQADTIRVRRTNLSGGHVINVVVNGDSYSFYNSNAHDIVVNGFGGNDKIEVEKFYISTVVSVNAGKGDDTIEVGDGYFAENVDGRVNLDAGEGNDTLQIDDSKSNFTQFHNDVYRVTNDRIEWGAQNSADVSFFSATVKYKNLEHTTLTANDHRPTELRVESTPANMSLVFWGGDQANTVKVGKGDLEDNIKGSVAIYNGNGNDSIRFDDGADSGNDAYTITQSRITKAGMANVDFFDSETVELNANLWNNDINIDSVSSRTNLLHVLGNGGADNFDVGAGRLSNIAAKLNLSGGDGIDSLHYFDSQDTTKASYNLTDATLVRNGTSISTHTAMDRIYLHASQGSNVIHVRPSTKVDLTIYGNTNGGLGDTLTIDLFQAKFTELQEISATAGVYKFSNARNIGFTGIEHAHEPD